MSRWHNIEESLGWAAIRVRHVAERAAIVVVLTLACAATAAAQTPPTLTTVAGGGPQNVPAALANIADATSMVRDSGGNFYIAVKRRVLKYDAATATIIVLAGTGFPGYTGDHGPASQATFRGPLSLAIDPAARYLYIGDSESRVVRRVELSSGNIGTYASGSATVPIRSIGALTARGNGTVYIADPAQCVILIRGDGPLGRYAGTGVCEGSIDGPGGDPSDDYMQGAEPRNTPLHSSLGAIQYDHDFGHFYFVEQSRVRMVPSAFNEVHVLAGTAVARWSVDGQGGFPGDDFIEGADARTVAIGSGARLFLDRAASSLLIIESTPNPFLRGAPDINVRAVALSFDLSSPIITTVAARLPMASGIGVARSETPNLYVMGRRNNGIQILEVMPDGLSLVAGNGIEGCGSGQLATEACVPAPVSVITDASAGQWILETSPAPVRLVDPTTGVISTVSAPDSFLLGQPGDFVAAPNGFYISNLASNQVMLQDVNGGITPAFGVAHSQPGDPLGDGGPAAFATFHGPRGLARDAQGNLFVADSLNRRVRRIDLTVGIVTTVAGDGTSCRPPLGGSHNLPPNPRDGSPAVAACLDTPARLAFDLNGDLLVTEASGSRIRRIAAGADGLITGAADEIIQTIAGTSAAGYSGDGGEAIQARIGAPIGIAVAPDGSIYFSDIANRVIRRIDGSTQVITTVAGTTGNGPSDRFDFVSDPTWTVLDSTGNNVGLAQNVCLNAFAPSPCPTGAAIYGYPGGGWVADLSAIPGASWIWAPGLDGTTVGGDNATYAFTKTFHLAGTPTFGSISVAADNAAIVLVNGAIVGVNQNQGALDTFDITSFLVAGQNTISIVAHNQSIGCPSCPYSQNPAGVVFGGDIRSSSVPGAPLNPTNTVLDTPMGVAVGEESGQHYLYFADSGLDRVLRIPITVSLPPPSVNISIAAAQVAEGASGSTQLAFTVTLDQPSTQPVSVNFDTADDTATIADNDYAVAAGTLTFAPGETSKQIVVAINGDNVNEGDEKLFLKLSSASGGTLSVTQAVGTITDDDPVTISVSDVTLDEGNSGTTKFNFVVTLSNPSTRTVVVDYTTADDTATSADSDYVPISGQLRFSAGETSQTVTVDVTGDTTSEPDERFFLNLSNPVRATIAVAQAIGTLTSDDAVMIVINETINVLDSVGVTPSVMLTVPESITVTDSVGVTPSVMLTVPESITVTDSVGVTPSVMLTIPESITVTDTVTPSPSVMLTIPESITVTDSVTPSPSVMLTIPETITVTDTVTSSPSVMLTIPETITVTDTVGAAPQGGTATPAGSLINVLGRDLTGALQPVNMTFANVVQPGVTFADPLPAPPPFPANFTAHSIALDITTTAQVSGPITICFTGTFPPRSRLLHHTSGAWADVTTSQTATQVCGQTNSLSPFVVGSFANTMPTLSLPANISAEATSAGGAAVAYATSANDAEDGSVAAACSPASGSTFPLGSSAVNCTATDSDGAQGSGSFTVTVQDTTAPSLTLPANITVTATSASGANVTFTASALDAVSGAITPSCTPASGALFAVGSTPVNCSATDVAGNAATGIFSVIVNPLPPAGPPRLAGAIVAKGRDASGNFFVDLRLSNTGTGAAHKVSLTGLTFRTLAGTGTVTYNATLSGALPMQVGLIDARENRIVRIYLNLPAAVTRFSITETGSMRDASGTQLNFSLGQSVIP